MEVIPHKSASNKSLEQPGCIVSHLGLSALFELATGLLPTLHLVSSLVSLANLPDLEFLNMVTNAYHSVDSICDLLVNGSSQLFSLDYLDGLKA